MTRAILLSYAIAAMLSAQASLPAFAGGTSIHGQYDMNTTVEHDQAGSANKQRAQKSPSKPTSMANSPTQQAPQTSNTTNWGGQNEKWLRDRY